MVAGECRSLVDEQGGRRRDVGGAHARPGHGRVPGRPARRDDEHGVLHPRGADVGESSPRVTLRPVFDTVVRPDVREVRAPDRRRRAVRRRGDGDHAVRVGRRADVRPAGRPPTVSGGDDDRRDVIVFQALGDLVFEHFRVRRRPQRHTHDVGVLGFTGPLEPRDDLVDRPAPVVGEHLPDGEIGFMSGRLKARVAAARPGDPGRRIRPVTVRVFDRVEGPVLRILRVVDRLVRDEVLPGRDPDRRPARAVPEDRPAIRARADVRARVEHGDGRRRAVGRRRDRARIGVDRLLHVAHVRLVHVVVERDAAAGVVVGRERAPTDRREGSSRPGRPLRRLDPVGRLGVDRLDECDPLLDFDELDPGVRRQAVDRQAAKGRPADVLAGRDDQGPLVGGVVVQDPPLVGRVHPLLECRVRPVLVPDVPTGDPAPVRNDLVVGREATPGPLVGRVLGRLPVPGRE